MHLGFLAVSAGLEVAFPETHLAVEKVRYKYCHTPKLIILVGFAHPILAVMKRNGSNSSSSTSLQSQAAHDVMRNSLS